MVDHTLRGTRLGNQSLQSEQGVELASRRKNTYRCADGSTFEVTFSSDAEVPDFWENPRTSREGVLLDPSGNPVRSQFSSKDEEVRPDRTHFDILLERRSREELQVLLDERLAFFRARHDIPPQAQPIGA